MIKDSIFLVVQNLRRRQRRSILTMIGIFIGIAAVVSLVSLGQGMEKAILSQFASVGGDKVIIQAKSGAFGPPGTLAGSKLTDNDLEQIRSMAGVQDIAGRLLKQALVVFNHKQKVHYVTSMPNSNDANLIIEANNLKIAEGRMIKPEDKNKVIIGNGLADKTEFGKEIRVGNKIQIKGKDFQVIGILQKLGDPMRNTAVIMNQDDLRDLYGIKDKELSVIVARAAPGSDPQQVALNVKKELRRYRHEKEGKETFEVQTSAQLIETFKTILNIVQAVLVGIAGISLLVGGIGIMNTMYTAVLERTKEIGIMKAIGGTRGQIMAVFVIESGFLGFFGGLVGIMLGILMSKLISLGASQFFGSNILQASFPWYLIVGAMAFSYVIGTAAGVVPALRAAKLQPVDALREE